MKLQLWYLIKGNRGQERAGTASLVKRTWGDDRISQRILSEPQGEVWRWAGMAGMRRVENFRDKGST